MASKVSKIKLIYNPNAGKKRKHMGASGVSLEQVKALLKQYQIPVDYAPTKGPHHATELARECVKDGYDMVLVAGGDGTVNEAANGLVGSDTTLGVIPMGTFMNIAKMLSIPMDIEKAVQLIKIGRVRKIDVGMVTRLEGEKLSGPFYFLESSGIGMDAHIQQYFKYIEQGKLQYIYHLIKKFFTFSIEEVKIITDEKTLYCHASLINIANGPFTGANLKIAPNAKLNDHRLTVAIYKMTKWELIKYFFRMKITQKTDLRRLQTIKSKTVKVTTTLQEMLVHIDASLFGITPVSYSIKPSALNVICGFPASEEQTALKSRTLLDP